MNQRKVRKVKTFTARLQAEQGTPLAEIIDYLNARSRADANRKVAETLLMCLLPLARQLNEYDSEKLRITCLEACDALGKHASYLRQALMVPQPQLESSQRTLAEEQSPIDSPETEISSENQYVPLIESKASAAQVEQLF